ncbi:hypothetical protein ACF0H5_006405 [Mactra antiquata]
MGTALRQDVDFNTIFKKLGHHLEEIRVRALESILSKLEHKIICDSDIVQERHLFIRLLEWFNFPKSTRHSDVLNLLLRLSKHKSASETIQDVGGIEFLTLLRKDVSSALQPIIDQILENAMRLPEVELQDHAPECIYQRQNITGATGGGMETTMDSVVTRQTVEPASSTVQPSEIQQKIPDYREPPLGFFEGDHTTSCMPVHESTNPQQVQPMSINVTSDNTSSFHMTIFPWLPLSSTDQHVIVSTNSSLQSREASMLVSTCEFLSDVVFQDFPAEIFLQRPSIIKNLLSLLSGPTQDMGRPRLQAIRTLADYCTCLKSRIHRHQDPNLYTAKQDFTTTPSPFSTPSSSTSNNNNNDGRPSLIGWTDTRPRGDGRDGDTSASSTGSSHASSVGLSPDVDIEQMNFEDIQSLQFIQMTIPQFCATILEKSLPLLKTDDAVISVEIFHLLNQILDIIAIIVRPELWQDQTMAARDCSEKFIESLNVISSLLKHHHHSNQSHDSDDSNTQEPGDLVQHRMIYIGLSTFVGKFMKMMIPIDKSQGVISEELISTLHMMVYDESLSNALTDLQILLLGYIKHLDEGKYQVYVDTATLCQSLQKACKFMNMCQEEATRMSKDTLSMCEGAFISLTYHRHMNYVTELVKLSSDICSKSPHYEVLQKAYRKLVLKCLSHPVDKIRQHTYTTVLQSIQNNLSVSNATDPTSTSCNKVKYLLHSDILHEIVVFGLADTVQVVSSLASDIMSHLLKSQLLMTPELWQMFLQALMSSLPILQSYSGPTTVLGTTILSMLETRSTESPNELTRIEKFRGTLRCLLSSDIKVRSDALRRLPWYITNETNSSKKLPVFSELDVSNLANLFIVDTPRSVEDELGRSVFQVDGLRKVYEIFTSLSVDPSVKKSAVDQLAIILQDPALHSAFKKDGGLEKILEHLQLGVLKDGDSITNNYMQYISGCITVLRYLVHHDYALRHKLAQDPSMYYTLLRVALLHHHDDRTCYEVSHLLTLLLFDEQSRFYMGGKNNTNFSVPNIIKLRYKLPFRPSTHYTKSPNQCPSTPDPDPFLTRLPLEMMRLSWNIAWNSGIDNLIKTLTCNKRIDSDAEFSPKLKLTPTDRTILITSHIKHGLQTGLYDISNATSHFGVSRSLTRLLGYMMSWYNSEVMDVFHTMDWCNTLSRFVKVTPGTGADESLLLDILRFISIVLKLTNHVPDNILQWVGEVLYHPKGPLIGLLHRQTARESAEEVSEPTVSVKRSLDKSLLTFISAYNSSLPYLLSVRLKFHQLRGDLAYKLLQRLNVTDAPHFYNLASLEGTLHCFMHITARPGWSEESTELEKGPLCRQVLNCILEVISAFHIGRGGTSISFMGKGVTKAAALCLRHLIYEMASVSEDQTWTKSWLYCRHADDVNSEPDLDWLLTLWAYRDAEVRIAGLGIAVTLSSTEEGRLLLTTNCKHIPGGIWAAAFSILLDQSECSMVRQQAALLLVNLTSQTLPSGSSESDHKTWQGPVVVDTEYQVSLTGLTALLALLHHCQFYREMTVLLSSYYPQPTIQPSITSELYQLSASASASESTLNILADAGIVPKTGGSHQNTMSMLQSSMASSTRYSERPGAVGANIQQTPVNNRSSPQADTRQEDKIETEYQSITTPCLVSSISQLVRNLMIQSPQDTVTSLKNESLIPFFVSLIDANFLEGIQVLTSSEQLELFFSELIEMHINILNLLRTCLVHDSSTRMDILQDKVALGGIVSLLRIFSDVSMDTRSSCLELWEAVITFLTTLIQMQCAPAVTVLAQVLQKQWSPIVGNLYKILDGKFENRRLYIHCVNLLAVLCNEESKLQSRNGVDENTVSMTTLLDKNLPSDDTSSKQVTAGTMFCKALLTSYDQFILRKSESHQGEGIHVITALKSLLAVSSTAKVTALESGLVENLISHIKHTNDELNMNVLLSHKDSTKVKSNPGIYELTLTFDLLRNFLYRNTDVKMACYHSNLHDIIYKLWSWCQLDITLMFSVVSLLTTYSGSCPTACSSLAYCSSATSVSTSSVAVPGGKSLVHCVIKYLNKGNHKEQMMKCIFGLLSNLAMSSECRSIIWKSNFLLDFGKLNPKRSKGAKPKGKSLCIESLWLDVLLNLSFSLEGQQMILKIQDVVDILLEFIEGSNEQHQEYAVTIIRNICCHTSNKSKVLANEKVISRLLHCMESNNQKIKTLGASALWALVYKYQKAKVAMKNSNVVGKLQEISKNGNITENCMTDINSVMRIVSD